MNFLDLFAGIGGFRLGMERAGHTCVGYCEIDKFARLSYQEIHDTKGEIDFKDITEVTNEEFRKLIGHLRGECTSRVFPIRDNAKQINELPKKRITTNTLTAKYTATGNGSYIIENKQKKVALVKEATKQGYAVANIGDSINLSHPNSKTRRGRVGKNIANTLLTSDEQGVVLPQIIQKPHGFNKGGAHNIAPTLTKSSYQENNFLKTEGVSIRKLTPRECWRLQGFPDWAFDKAQKVNSNSQLYKQAGNSVTVNVIEEIAKKLK